MSRVYKGLGVRMRAVRVLSRWGSPCRQSRPWWGTFGKVRGLKVRSEPQGVAKPPQALVQCWGSDIQRAPSPGCSVY